MTPRWKQRRTWLRSIAGHERSKPSDLAVALAILEHVFRDTEEVEIGHADLAALTKLSQRQLCRSVEALRSIGALLVTRLMAPHGQLGRNRYRPLWSFSDAPRQEQPSMCHPGTWPGAKQGGSPCATVAPPVSSSSGSSPESSESVSVPAPLFVYPRATPTQRQEDSDTLRPMTDDPRPTSSAEQLARLQAALARVSAAKRLPPPPVPKRPLSQREIELASRRTG